MAKVSCSQATRCRVMFAYVVAAIFALALVGYFWGWRQSLSVAGGRASTLHSRPGYYGAFVAAWVGIPSFVLVLLWVLFQGPVIDSLLLTSLPAEKTVHLSDAQADLLISEIKQV